VTTLGWVGVAILVAAGLAILVEGAVAAVWGGGVARRAATLSERLQTERGLLEADLEKLRLAMAETRRLWRPYRIGLRWLSHPLTIALWQSYRRRWILR
jgi:hypothetical protein